MMEVEGKGRKQRMIDLLSSGVPQYVVSDLPGHESINTTAGYVTPSDAARQTAVESLSVESSEPESEAPPLRPSRRAQRA
jgi:hypothetical protein